MLAGAPCSICRANVELEANDKRGAVMAGLDPKAGNILHRIRQAGGREDRQRLGAGLKWGQDQ